MNKLMQSAACCSLTSTCAPTVPLWQHSHSHNGDIHCLHQCHYVCRPRSQPTSLANAWSTKSPNQCVPVGCSLSCVDQLLRFTVSSTSIIRLTTNIFRTSRFSEHRSDKSATLPEVWNSLSSGMFSSEIPADVLRSGLSSARRKPQCTYRAGFTPHFPYRTQHNTCLTPCFPL